ncbi:MAG: DEAD/DEAH box helicase [Nocardioides sp.]|uniref:DEAD/DEAH box helicase n=1 Tax=Nocardioides sp. TaxID=35761 RepID=UPI0023947781|nr:DEAD/DEAH box helicase [Nocardioides sp.]MDE0778277.1 DEAD/DEAH box helicase [Nocardioides sp.]
MDRALNPEILAEAIGQHTPGVLPTVEELTALIAEVEVRTFIEPTDVDDDLLRTAWYLHGVASAEQAGDIYTPARQQRAFAVSAHIFDLALNGPSRTIHDQLTLAFGAQVGYRRGDLEPNATAIWRRVNRHLDQPQSETDEAGTPDADAQWSDTDHTRDAGDAEALVHLPRSLATMALRAGVAFLGLDVRRIQILLRQWRDEITSMRSLLNQDSLASTMFGPAEAVTQAVSDLMVFLRYGDRERLRAARDALRSVVNLEAGQGDHDARWVAVHLLHIADGMETSSVWAVLPDDTPPIVAQAFTIGTPPVLTLWPPQRDLLTRNTANPLDPTTRRLLLSVPTSAGKTLIAQLLICHHLVTQPGNVCYVTPLRSLGREMRQALSGRMRVIQKGLGADFADFGNVTIEEFFDLLGEPADGSVEVMTPERLSHLLRHDPTSVLERYSMFVIDEAHLLAQPGRGLLLETVIAAVATTDARIVLLSGVMGNAHQIASWLDPTQEAALFESGWRGPRRLHALLYSQVEGSVFDRLPSKSSTFTHLERFPITADLRVRPVEGTVHRLVTTADSPIGHLVRKMRPPGTGRPDVEEYDAFYRMCARTARELLGAGSLLMILSRRDYARNAAQELTARLDVTHTTSDLCEFLVERLGAEHPLIDCVRHGVAYHHAGLPIDVLDELEQAMRAETLQAIFATSTLTDGVNLPVRTVVICETRYEGQDPGQQLDGPRLLNAVGRAGRAGKETEGWIILGLKKRARDSDFDQLQPADSDLEILSTLNSEVALERLAEVEALIASTADALFAVEQGEAADFAAYVWFVLSAQERLAAVATDADLAGAIDGLLAFVQLPPATAARWKAFAEYVREQYEATPDESRLRWTLTGTTLASARRIEQIALTVADQARTLFGELDEHGTAGPVLRALTLEEAMRVLDRSGALDALLQLPEAAGVWKFKPTVGARTAIAVPVADALGGWLAGLNMPDLAQRMLPGVPDVSWRLEQTVDAISGAFEHFLSWTIGVVTTQANELLVDQGGIEALPEDLAYFVRYGVDTAIALNLLTSGIRSRRVAHAIGRRATALGLDWSQVRDWLRGLHIDGWRTEFTAARREIEDLVEFCRSPTTSPLRQLLEQHTTAVELHAPMAPPPAAGRLPVELRITRGSEPIEVWTSGTASYRVGIIAAASHADVALLGLSGLEYRAETDGSSVMLHEVR